MVTLSCGRLHGDPMLGVSKSFVSLVGMRLDHVPCLGAHHSPTTTSHHVKEMAINKNIKWRLMFPIPLEVGPFI